MPVDVSTLRYVKSGQGSKQDSHQMVMKVRCTLPTDNTWTVYAHAITPKRGVDAPAIYGMPTGTRCLDSNVKPMGDSPWWFEITVDWGIPEFSLPPNPLDYVERYGGGVSDFEYSTKDADGKLLVNALGHILKPGILRPKADGQFGLVIRRTDIARFGSLSHRVNSNAIWGCGARTIKIGEISWRTGRESGINFWQISLPFQYREDGWRFKPLNVGFYAKPTATATYAQPISELGKDQSLPWPLESNGTLKSAPGGIVPDPDPLPERKQFTEIAYPSDWPDPFSLT